MTVEAFLSHLKGVRPHGPEKWAARCPSHEDRIGSLVVSVRDDGGGLVLKCHAGCDALAVVRSVGLELRDLFFATSVVERPGGAVNIADVKPAQSAKASAPKRVERPAGGIQMPGEPIVEGWERRLDGPLLARLLELKGWSERTLRTVRAGWDESRVTFPAYDLDGRMVGLVRYLPGGSPKSMAVGTRELWPAPETLPDGDVWLVEGEPDRVSAVEIGLNASSLPGLGKWRDDWAARFAGRRVTVCLDCDEPGRRIAAERVLQLREAGVEAAAVDLWPGEAGGYDLGDALVGAIAEGRVNDLRRYLLRLEDTARSAAA